MSTVVDNDKYIINGSTLSEIGDAVKGQMPNQYEKVTEDVVCYKYTYTARDNGVETLLNLTEETIQGWYQNTLPSPITKVKIINTDQPYNASYWPYAVVNGDTKRFTKNESYTYSLPITIKGQGTHYGDDNTSTFKIYPLNGDDYLFWDSNYYYPSSSSDYNVHLYKEGVSHERLLPKTFLVSDIPQKIASLGAGTLETWYWSSDQSPYYLPFPSGFSVKNLKDLTCLSGNYPRGLYKDSLGKPVSMKDQEISLSSSFNIGSPLTQAKISAAYNEGRTFCIPWPWKGVKTIPDDVSFIWFVVEPADSKIYIGAGRYVNSTGIGKCTVFYTT